MARCASATGSWPFSRKSPASYARLPWQLTGIDPPVSFTDLRELCVRESHGLLHQRERAQFASLDLQHHDLIETLLWSLAAERRSALGPCRSARPAG